MFEKLLKNLFMNGSVILNVVNVVCLILETSAVSSTMPGKLVNKAFGKAKTLKSVPGSMGKAAKSVFLRQVTEYDEDDNRMLF